MVAHYTSVVRVVEARELQQVETIHLELQVPKNSPAPSEGVVVVVQMEAREAFPIVAAAEERRYFVVYILPVEEVVRLVVVHTQPVEEVVRLVVVHTQPVAVLGLLGEQQYHTGSIVVEIQP